MNRAVNLNSINIVGAAANLTKWSRYALDAHTAAITHARTSAHREHAKDRAWELWKVLFWGNVSKICIYHFEAGSYDVDPFRLEQDIEALRCAASPRKLTPPQVPMPDDVMLNRLTAIETTLNRLDAGQQLLAAHMAGLKVNGPKPNTDTRTDTSERVAVRSSLTRRPR